MAKYYPELPLNYVIYFYINIYALFSNIKYRVVVSVFMRKCSFLKTKKVSISGSNCLVGIVPPTLSWSLAPVGGHGRERVVWAHSTCDPSLNHWGSSLYKVGTCPVGQRTEDDKYICMCSMCQIWTVHSWGSSPPEGGTSETQCNSGSRPSLKYRPFWVKTKDDIAQVSNLSFKSQQPGYLSLSIQTT